MATVRRESRDLSISGNHSSEAEISNLTSSSHASGTRAKSRSCDMLPQPAKISHGTGTVTFSIICVCDSHNMTNVLATMLSSLAGCPTSGDDWLVVGTDLL